MLRAAGLCVLTALGMSACALPAARNASQVVVEEKVVTTTPTPEAAQGGEPLMAAIADLDPNSVEAQALAALANGQSSKAVQIIDTAFQQNADSRLHWLAATATQKADMPLATLEHLQTLAQSAHPLAKPAGLWLAEFVLRVEPQRAADLTASLLNDWSGAERSTIIHARALEKLDRRADAIALLRPLATDGKDRIKSSGIAMELASQLGKSDDLSVREEALSLYRAVASRGSSNSFADEAATKASAILQSLPDAERKAFATPRALDRFGEALSLYNQSRNKDAARAFGRLAKSLKTGSPLWCKTEMMRGRAQLRMRDRDKGSKLLVSVANTCADADVVAWSRYLGGRALGRIGQWQDAIAQYDKLIADHPRHTLADDAAYRSALAELELGHNAAYEQKLKSVAHDFRDGDMWPRALFQLAWDAKRSKDHKTALVYLEELIERGEPRDDEAKVGQATYWRGRILETESNIAEAEATYESVAKKWPLRYYGQLALERLSNLNKDKANAIEASMQSDEKAESMSFPHHEAFETESFTRAIEFLRVKEIARASKELEYLKSQYRNDADELRLVAAVLIQRADQDPRVDYPVRRHFRNFAGLMPVGEGRALWELAYPQSYNPMIESVAKRENIQASFLRGIAREESSFAPEAVSPAGAYGLVQLILPTAKRFGTELKLRATPRTLKKPETNLRIGARFISWLFDRNSHPGVVAASYNAGEGAVRRWLSEYTGIAFDEFVEEIPYDETRRYTRRVLQSYGIYSWLYQNELPKLPLELPIAVNP